MASTFRISIVRQHCCGRFLNSCCLRLIIFHVCPIDIDPPHLSSKILVDLGCVTHVILITLRKFFLRICARSHGLGIYYEFVLIAISCVTAFGSFIGFERSLLGFLVSFYTFGFTCWIRHFLRMTSHETAVESV